MAADAPVDPAQRRLAERRFLSALRRMHRREPLRPDIRVDALIEAVRSSPPSTARGHRGSTRLVLSDAALLDVLAGLAEAGRVVRHGRRVRLPEHAPAIGEEMRGRIDRLMAGLREAGVNAPRVEGPAARLGIPPALLAQLRAAGELVAVAPGIDYPRDTWESIDQRVALIAEGGPLTVARVRDVLRTSRRHAAAILDYRRARRSRTFRSPRLAGPAPRQRRPAPHR